MENPFSSPQTASTMDAGDFAPLPPERERLALLGEVVVAWERLRIWYNVVLAAVALISILLFQLPLLFHMGALEDMVLAAIAANACFLAGPLLEGYVTWWFGPVPWLRQAVFIIGTLGAVVLTIAVVVALTLEFGPPAPENLL